MRASSCLPPRTRQHDDDDDDDDAQQEQHRSKPPGRPPPPPPDVSSHALSSNPPFPSIPPRMATSPHLRTPHEWDDRAPSPRRHSFASSPTATGFAEGEEEERRETKGKKRGESARLVRVGLDCVGV